MSKKQSDFLEAILDKFGEDVLQGHSKEIRAISTGALSLDTSIGIGGIPRGRITEIYGSEGTGKTTLALNTAKILADNGEKTLYIDVENLLNTETLRSVLGPDAKVENIVILTPESAEDAFMMAEAGIDSNEFGMIVIDSIGAMSSRKEKEVDFDKDTMMQIPRIVSKFIGRNIYAIRVNNIAFVVLNQVRDNVGSYIKSFSTPGGHKLKHEASVRIALTKGEDLKRGNEIVGILTKFVIKKNKLAPPFRSFTIPIIFGEGIDYYSDLIDFAKLLGVIQGAGSYYKFNGETIGQGKSATRDFLISSKETLAKITEMCYNIVNKQSGISEILNDLEDGAVEAEWI
jgi:recombination protein RecA